VVSVTFQELKQECTTAPTGRFNSSTQDVVVGRWINRVYARWWNAYVWPWRVAPDQSLAITSGTRAYVVPADYGETWGLFDQYGDPLTYLPPRDFLAYYSGTAATQPGQPVHYTLMGGSVYFGPTPNVTTTFKWQYLKRCSHFNTGTLTVTTGFMSDNGDIPIMGWASTHEDYHYALVPGAQALGLSLSNAPPSQWKQLKDTYDEMLAEAVQAYGRAEKGEVGGMGSRVWGDAYAGGGSKSEWR
jgi:hypothetical protein